MDDMQHGWVDREGGITFELHMRRPRLPSLEDWDADGAAQQLQPVLHSVPNMRQVLVMCACRLLFSIKSAARQPVLSQLERQIATFHFLTAASAPVL